MKVLKLVFALMLAAFVAACAPMGGGSPPPIATSGESARAVAQAHMVCERTEQKGCIEFDILNLRYNPKSIFQKGLDKPSTSEAERRRRALELGPELYKAYKAGYEQASQPRDFLIFMWNTASVPLSHMRAYQLDGFELSFAPFSEMTGAVAMPVFEPLFGLGKPDRVFRIRADGKKPIGAAFQVPWSMIGEGTYILVCTEDDLAVHPNRITAKEGFWLTPEYLNAVKARRWDYILMPFISKDRPVPKRSPALPPKKKVEGDLTVAMATEGEGEK